MNSTCVPQNAVVAATGREQERPPVAKSQRSIRSHVLRWLSISARFDSLSLLLLTVIAFPSQPSNLLAASADGLRNTSHGLALRWVTEPGSPSLARVEVAGLDEATLRALRGANWDASQWQRVLSVYAEQGNVIADIHLPPMAGAHRIAEGVLRFEPQFPLQPGVRYRAVFHPSGLPGGRNTSAMQTAAFRAPAAQKTPSTVVIQVYPTAAVLPENLLKFYVHFSAPMSRGRIYDHIHLRDETGREVELPFLEIDEELWNHDMTRLTLFIDPGRIKRGVQPLEEIGPALEEGKRYTLVIDRSWADGSGTPMKRSFEKTFTVGAPDRSPPDPAHWKIHPPRSGTVETLTVTFPEPMDHALSQRLIHVHTGAGENVPGEITLDGEERRWSFRPAEPWRRDEYKLTVQTAIEDLAGNNIGKPFEVDLFEGVERRITRSIATRPFRVE